MIKLIKLRNPWGSEDYFGPWSDKSTLWTDDLKRQVGGVKVNDKDGIFFLEFNYMFRYGI